MVELRKRPPPKEPATPAPTAKRGSGASSKMKALANKAKAAVTGTGEDEAITDAPPPVPAATGAVPETTMATGSGKESVGSGSVGSTINLQGFGGKVSTHDGVETSLAELIEKSGSGVVLFTYPKASTPGCTTQACLFRDSYAPISGASLAVYGLSTDSPKANTTFANKHSLPFPLLCDPAATLTTALGLKKPGPGKSTTRGVALIDKQGILQLWETGGPQKTLDVVLEYVKTKGMTETGGVAAVAAPPPDDARDSEKAAVLADPYKGDGLGVGEEKMDEMPLVKTPTPQEAEAADTAAEVGEVAAKLDRA